MRNPLTILWEALCEARFLEEATIIWRGILRVLAEMSLPAIGLEVTLWP